MKKDSIEYLVAEIDKWSKEYEFQFQFWGSGNNSVFICKGHVELISFGCEDTVKDILKTAVDWVHSKNRKGTKPTEQIRRCMECGTAIAKGNDLCGECACEDDGEI